jgi:hypothetical protein
MLLTIPYASLHVEQAQTWLYWMQYTSQLENGASITSPSQRATAHAGSLLSIDAVDSPHLRLIAIGHSFFLHQ